MNVEGESVDRDACAGNAAPFVLGALTDEEQRAFAAHVETCAVCREEVAALQSVADTLGASVPQMRAPSSLKRSVMAEVRKDERVRRATSPRRERARRRQTRSWGIAGSALAAAAVVLVVLLSAGGSSPGTRVIPAQVGVPSADVSLKLTGDRAELDIANLPPTQPGRVYEVWLKRSGAPQPTDALFTVNRAGDATVGVPGSVAGVSEVLVSSEPLGGSTVPTRTPVIVAKLA